MSVDNSIRGRVNRKAGLIFEKFIEEACFTYELQGIAYIQKTPEPMTPIKPYGNRKEGKFIACYTKQAQPDFKGTLKGGRSVLFDAKHTINDRIQQSVVTEKQWEMFDKSDAMGAYCWVVVSLEDRDYYRVPWQTWKNMKQEFGHLYMSRQELEPYRIPCRGMEVLFLEGVEL